MQRAVHPITYRFRNWITVTILFLTLVLPVHPTHAQTSSQKGWFTVDFTAGCYPVDVTLTNTGVRSGSLFVDFMGDENDPYSNVGFTDTFDPGEILTTSYTSAGVFLIRVVDQSGAGAVEDRFDFIEITVLEPEPPSYTAALCNNNRVLLTFDFTQDNYDSYNIDFGDGSPATVFDKSGSNETSHTYALQGDYSIRVMGQLNDGSDINCGTSAPLAVSTIQSITTPQITAVTLLDEQTVEISYEPLTANIEYVLLLKPENAAFSIVAQIDPVSNPTSYTHTFDAPSANTLDYQFQLGAFEACGTVQNYSNIVHTVRTGYTTAYLNGNEFTLTTGWNTSFEDSEIQGVTYFFDGVAEAAASTPSGEIRKVLASCLDIRPYYYEVAVDGAVSRSITFAPDLSISGLSPPRISDLQGQLAGAAVILSYEQAPVPASEYRIYEVGDALPELTGTTTELSFTVDDFVLANSEVCFVISYVDECGFESNFSNERCFEFSPSLTLPNAFSPNGDNFNDTFGVPAGVYPDFQMLIYNRWGKLVYSSRNATATWDGMIAGQEAPTGSYIYRINYNFAPNSPVSLTGNITLIR